MTTLYKMNNNNLISWWTIEVHEDGYSISWGQDHTHQVGQKNFYHTGDRDRAEVEAMSRVNKQIERRGYSEEVPAKTPDLPMLAQKYADHQERVLTGTPDWSEFALQPKLDGLRCLASKNKLVTRQNLTITCLDHLTMLTDLLPEEMRLDGELFIHGVDLQTIQSYVRRQRPIPGTNRIEFHVFDLVDTELPFRERIELVENVVSFLEDQYDEIKEFEQGVPEKLRGPTNLAPRFPIKVVPTSFVKAEPCSVEGQHIISRHHKNSVEAGYEGSIIRKADHYYYMNYRSPELLKYKEFMDEEFEIVDIDEGYNSTGIFVCKTKDNKWFKATPSWTTPRKKKLLLNKEKYIGRMLTVEFEKYSADGIPLKPIGKSTREVS